MILLRLCSDDVRLQAEEMAHSFKRFGLGQGVDRRRGRICMKNRAEGVAEKIGGRDVSGFVWAERRALKVCDGGQACEDDAKE
jgi:hypothetical protein